MDKKIGKAILALVMVAAGLAGFLWEFTIMESEYFSVIDTHYGNRFEYHFLSSAPPDNISYLREKDVESGLREFLEARMPGNKLYYSFNNARRNVPGIEWLVKPVLPQGCVVESVQWHADRVHAFVSGDVSGRVTICNLQEYGRVIKAYRQSRNSEKWSGCYTLGNRLVKRSEYGVTVLGVSNGFSYCASIKIPDGAEFTDKQIRNLGVGIAAPQSWEVTLLVLVNVLRGLCFAMAVAGVVLLVVPVLKRKKTAPAVL